MFLALWYYFHGYVIISVTGFSVERFVNLAAYKGIYLWDIHPEGTGVTMKVSVDGFRMLKECGRKTGCRFKILERRGFPFTVHHYHKRKILAAGVLFFVAGLYILSSFVWVIKVEGNERISQEQLLQICEEMGLKPGVWKKKVNTKNITEKLIENFEDISWVSVKIQGTNAQINIVETIPKTEIIDRQTPMDIIAAKEGVIVHMAVSAGGPQVKINDVVEKGDLLVSSEVPVKDGEQEIGKEYVHAEAVIKAKLWYDITEEIDLNYTEKQYTGEYKDDTSVIVKDNMVDFIKPNIKYEHYDVEELYEKPFSIGDYKFPVALKKERYKEYQLIEKTRTVEEAKKELNVKIEQQTKKLLKTDSELIDIQTTFIESENKLTAKAIVTMIERIDEERKLENWSDTQDGTSGENSEH